MRHGLAVDREEFAKKHSEDNLRPLTLKGRRRTQKVAMQMREWIKEVDVIVSSPFTRARQTAEIVSQIFLETKVIEAPELVPSSPPQAFKRWLRSHGDDYKKILIVGHEPHLGILTSYLMADQVEPLLNLKKSGALSLKVDSFKNIAPGTAKLQWLLQPRHFVD
jgi:phosphohistidine phosphatase